MAQRASLLRKQGKSRKALYLKKCQQAGYNVVQIQVMDGVPSYNIYGQPSLTDGWNFDKIKTVNAESQKLESIFEKIFYTFAPSSFV